MSIDQVDGPQLGTSESSDDTPQRDLRRLHQLVAQHEGVGVGVLRELFIGGNDARGPRERFDAAFSRAQLGELVIQTDDGVRLTDRGRWLFEQQQATVARPRQPEFAELRQAYIASLPERRRVLAQQARALQIERSERQRREERLLGRFIPHMALTAELEGWRIGAEREIGADNVLAIYPPTFDALPASDVYVRVAMDEAKHVCWLRSSRGGPLVGVGEGWDSATVRAAILQVWVPAVDQSAPALPTLSELLEEQHHA
jgi:hypothetical protein